MASVCFSYVIAEIPEKVFLVFASTYGLSQWWAKQASGIVAENTLIRLNFGEGIDWEFVVQKLELHSFVEYRAVNTAQDWQDSTVSIKLMPVNRRKSTKVEFCHSGWKAENEHFKITSYCWALYLRIAKKFLEIGTRVNYEDRLLD